MAKRKSLPAGDSDYQPENPPQIKEEWQHFARHYARHSNATLAYHYAYPKANASTCRKAGSKLTTNCDIMEFVELYREKNRQVVTFSFQDYLKNMIAIAENPDHKQQREANNDLKDALGLGKEAGKGNWFDGFERIAELVSNSKGKK